MYLIPENFETYLESTINEVKNIKGHLPKRDLRFLCFLGMIPTTSGEVLEIGSFRGKSTVALAKSVEFFDIKNKINAVDPFILESVTDPLYKSEIPIKDEFLNNLKDHNVENKVEFFHMKSEELGKMWNKKIRLLWIDGDHTYHGAKTDLETFLPYLKKGAIVAFHDVLNTFDGPVRVVAEQILLSEKFGSFGFCGSIGWGQYIGEPNECENYYKEKLKYYKKLHRLVPYVALNPKKKDTNLMYKLNRALIPHDEIQPNEWIKKVKFFN
ncbi:MAG: class I SAM-dependent methyltransferase [Ignavibacteriales bacterium]|nr:class I SAM-dependent methyltransferase [Ignavibacteriales bacterium]